MAAPTESLKDASNLGISQETRKEAYDWTRAFVEHIRACSYYKEELKECTEYRGRFQQYFVYGENLDCSVYQELWDHCSHYKETQNQESLEYIVEYEMNRNALRALSVKLNNVWEYRDKPPESWTMPIDELRAKNYAEEKQIYQEQQRRKVEMETQRLKDEQTEQANAEQAKIESENDGNKNSEHKIPDVQTSDVAIKKKSWCSIS